MMMMMIVKECAVLKVLVFCFQNNRIEEITIEHLASLPHLETLNLQNNRLTTDGEKERERQIYP